MTKVKVKGEKYSPTLDRIGQTQKREARIVSWPASATDDIAALVVAVTDAGGSVLFGATRDRGAWSVTIFHDQLPNKKRTEYCNGEEMFSDWLRSLCEIWQDIAAELASVE